MKRIILFVLTNLAIMITLSIVFSLLGFTGYLTVDGIDYAALMVFSLVWGFGGAMISLAISRWMAKKAMGVQLVNGRTGHDELDWMYQTVEHLTRKAGLPMPEVGVYESPEVNAFATGPSKSRSLVAVSSGLLRSMRREEVEGVLAHEISHIQNGDMVTMTLLQGTLNTFVIFLSRALGFAIDQLMRRGDDDRRGVGIGYYLGYIVCEIVLGILASLIVMAYSRHREFRADAMGARLEGKDAMIGALRRLKQITDGGGIIDVRSPAPSAFKSKSRAGLMRLFATHPPLEERIAALELKP